MPLIQGGPPECIWERTPDLVKFSIVPSDRDSETVYEFRVDCGMGIIRLQFFTADEIASLRAEIDKLGA